MRVLAATIIVGMCGAFFTATQAFASSVNIDFGSTRGTPSDIYGGAVGQTGVWNTIGLSGISDLVDINGVSGSLSLDFTKQYNPVSWNNTFSGSYRGGDSSLLYDHFYTGYKRPWDFTIGGLGSGTYDVYVYAPAHTSIQTGAFTINGIAQTKIAGSPSGTVDLGVDYLVARTIVSDGTMTFVSDGVTFFSGLAGLQISSVSAIPLPPSAILFGTALLSLAGLRRRKRKLA